MKRKLLLLLGVVAMLVAILPLTALALPPTFPADPDPGTPGHQGVTATQITHNSARVTWPAASDADPGGAINSYTVRLFSDLPGGGSGYDFVSTTTVGAGILTLVLNGLTPDVGHFVEIEAIDNGGAGNTMLECDPQPAGCQLSAFADVLFETDEAPPPPPPAEVTVGAVDPSTGVWRLRNSAGAITTFFYGNPGDYPFVGDWDCDGDETPGLYRQSDGFVYLRNSNSQGVANIRFFFGNPGDIPLAGDFDDDGCDTVSIYRPSQGKVYIINELGENDGGLGAADFSYFFGNPGDKPFTGDFNGDGVDTVGLHRESTGLVYFRNSNTQGNAQFQFFFGNPGDRLVAGDWGIEDGNDTPGLFRPGNRTWYFRHTNTQGNADSQFVWGSSHYLPVAGDFDLD